MTALLLELIIHHKKNTGKSSYHSPIGLVVVCSKTEYIVKFAFFLPTHLGYSSFKVIREKFLPGFHWMSFAACLFLIATHFGLVEEVLPLPLPSMNMYMTAMYNLHFFLISPIILFKVQGGEVGLVVFFFSILLGKFCSCLFLIATQFEKGAMSITVNYEEA